jgi:WD40 repeat protein
MSRLHLLFAATALLTFPTLALAAPVPRKSHPVISAANVDRLRPVGELKRPVWRIVPGPGRGELAFVGWKMPVEVVAEKNFRPIRKIADRRRPIHFAASKDGRRVAWCENNSRVVLQEVAGGKTVEIETGNPQPTMAFSPDGKLLATGGYGTRAKLWDVSGRLVRALDCGGEGGLWPVFSPDGKVLAVGNRNDQTRLFEVATGKLLHTLPKRMTQELAFHPDGNMLAVGYVDGTVALWDVTSGTLLRSHASGGKEVYTLAWGPKGDVLVTAGLAGKIVLWEPRKLTRLRELDAPAWVIHVRFTPDGGRLLTSGATEGSGMRDRKVTIWAIAEGSDR